MEDCVQEYESGWKDGWPMYAGLRNWKYSFPLYLRLSTAFRRSLSDLSLLFQPWHYDEARPRHILFILEIGKGYTCRLCMQRTRTSPSLSLRSFNILPRELCTIVK